MILRIFAVSTGVAAPARVGGFNLLPYRARDARRARQRCAVEGAGAAVAGCVAVLVLAGWQAFERSQLDAERMSIGHGLAQFAAPLAEHARLANDAAQSSERAARAVALSEPIVRVVDLLDVLGQMSADGVVVRQLRQFGQETELLATADDHVAIAEWIRQLGSMRGVKTADVSELRRVAAPTAGNVSAPGGHALEFTARLRWDEIPDTAAKTPKPEKTPPRTVAATAMRDGR